MERIRVHRQPSQNPVEPSQSFIPPIRGFTPHHVQHSTANLGSVSNSTAKSLQTPFPSHDFSRISILPKLTISQPNDPYEQEADRVAAEVVNQINVPNPAPIQRQGALEDEELQPKFLTNPIMPLMQREEMLEDEEELQMKPIQRVANQAGMAASPDLETSIAQARGGGQPLDQSIRAPIEQAMGADFSGVKIHTDAQADQLNRSVQARAFTTGQDVFFRQGEYNPGSRGGQELIAHELTHVVQQEQGSRAKVQRAPVTKDGKTIDDASQLELKPIANEADLKGESSTKWEDISENIEFGMLYYYVADTNTMIIWDSGDKQFYEADGGETWRPGVPGYKPREVAHYHCTDYNELLPITDIDAKNMGNVEENKLASLRKGFEVGHDIPAVDVTADKKLVNGKNRYILSCEYGYTEIPVKYP